MTLPKHVRRKAAKGRAYYYFDTGRKNEAGKPLLTRLPDLRAPDFGTALSTANRLRTMRQRPLPAFLTVAKMIDLFEKSREYRSKAKGTQTSYSHYFKQIRDEMGAAPVDDVKAADIHLLMEKRADRPAAANQIVRVVGALYAWGRKHHKTTLRPTENIEFNEIGEHEPWPEWLLEDALASDDDMVSLASALLYFTAQRLGDMLRMRWTDISAGSISVKQEKTSTPLDIAIHARLAERLARVPRRGFTILAKADGTAHSQSAVRRALQAFAAERGVKIVPHGLRKNAVNALLEAGCTVAQVQAVSGQSLQMIEHYAKRRNKTKLAGAAILKWQGNAS